MKTSTILVVAVVCLCTAASPDKEKTLKDAHLEVQNLLIQTIDITGSLIKYIQAYKPTIDQHLTNLRKSYEYNVTTFPQLYTTEYKANNATDKQEICVRQADEAADSYSQCAKNELTNCVDVQLNNTNEFLKKVITTVNYSKLYATYLETLPSFCYSTRLAKTDECINENIPIIAQHVQEIFHTVKFHKEESKRVIFQALRGARLCCTTTVMNFNKKINQLIVDTDKCLTTPRINLTLDYPKKSV